MRPRLDPGRAARWMAVAAGLCALAAAPAPAWAGTEWLPPASPFPRVVADLREPGTRLTYLPDPDRFDAALGAPLPLVGFPVRGRNLFLVLEAGAFFRLGKDGTFFPLQTFDGLLGLGVETAAGPFRGRLKAFHVSAHKADGDSTVAYRDRTFSRESWRLEGGLWWRGLFLFAGVGSSWHAVPRDEGMHIVGGGSWEAPTGSWRPVVAVQLLADAERAWRVNQSFLAGARTGTDRRFCLGLRYYCGNRVEGQYWTVPERYLGFEWQFSSNSAVAGSPDLSR